MCKLEFTCPPTYWTGKVLEYSICQTHSYYTVSLLTISDVINHILGLSTISDVVSQILGLSNVYNVINHILPFYISFYPGSFKIRGVANQFARRPKGGHFVTMSAGNYGKAFAYASKHYGSKGKVVMPETAPLSRSVLIQVSPHAVVCLDTKGYKPITTHT